MSDWRPVPDEDVPDAVPFCSDISPDWCAKNREAVDGVCHELDRPPGSKVLFQIDHRRCWCICGSEAAGGLEEMRARLAAWLGVDRPLPHQAVVAAHVHPGYRRKLAFARGSPEALGWLL